MPKRHRAQVELRILSYNLLAPLFVGRPGLPFSFFSHVALEHLDWASRRSRIEARLRRAGAELVCLQEVEYEPGGDDALPWVPPGWLEHLADELDLRVVAEPLSSGDWRRRAGRNARKAGRAAGVGLVTLVHTRWTEVEVLGANRAMLVSFGSPKAHFTVANVHLEGHPDKEEERVRQLRGVLERARRRTGHHVVVIGDWNTSAEPNTSVGAFLAGHEDMKRVPLGPTYGGAPGRPRSTDHILHDASLEIDEVRVDLSSEDARTGMPNAESPSDHAPISARVRVVGPPREAAPTPAPASSLSPDEARALQAAWGELLAGAPPRPEGRPPTPEERAALRAFKAKRQAFLADLPSDAHRRHVKKLG